MTSPQSAPESATFIRNKERKPTVIWITGYSGSGKTTIGRKIHFLLNERGEPCVLLDGDDLRAIFSGKWGYSKEERIELAHGYFRLANLLMSQGVTVVVSAVAMYRDVYNWVKSNVESSLVVYLDVPEDERLARDRVTKNIYKDIGNPIELYDDPGFADFRVENCGISTDESATLILAALDEIDSSRSSDKGRTAHWNEYYSNGTLFDEPSSFANLVMSRSERNLRLVEIGCGNGRDAFFFAEQGLQVTAIDPSQSAIDVCLASPAADRIRFVRATAEELLATDIPRFDIAYSRFCLHAMTESEEVATLHALAQLLHNDGKVFIECRSIHDPLALKGEVISLTERIHGHYRRFIVADELRQRLDRAGFDVLWFEEGRNLASIEGDNPVVIRLEAKKR